MKRESIRRKKYLFIAFCLALAMTLCVGLSACGGSDEETADQSQQETAAQDDEEVEDEDMDEGDTKDEEIEEAIIEAEENAEETPVARDMKYEDFVGTWETTTELADENFGGYKITFHKNKTFDAVITGEEESGQCTLENGVVSVQNDVVNDQLWFNEDGVLIVRSEQGAMAILRKAK